MNNTERALSVRVFDVMDKIGASEKIRKLVYQDMSITEEIIKTLIFEINSICCSAYIFGSFCEGTTTIGLNTDVDCVYCCDKFPVIDDINTAPPGTSILMVRDDHTYPGYVKLQTVTDGRPRTIFDMELTDGFSTDNKGRICFKHFSSNLPNEVRHGPADTTPEQKCYTSADTVYAFRCKTIPYCVREWVYRRRHHLWPSRGDLQTMSELGCFVVGVGHYTSQEFDIEWRLSFSLQERLLMFSFNPTQHKCYILLKLLIKEVIQQRLGESISSYHCKTCIFYAIENTKGTLWKPHKLLACVRVCLMSLLTWVYNGYCPNYFVPSENMFDRLCFRAKKDDLVQVLRDLVLKCPSYILHIHIIRNIKRNPALYSQNNVTIFVQYSKYFSTSRPVYELSLVFNKYGYNMVDPRCACLNLVYYMNRLNTTRLITEHTEQQTRDAISYVIPALHQQLAQRLVSFAFAPEGQQNWRKLLQLGLRHFRKGYSVDLLTSKLMIVTLLMRLQLYGVCEEILECVADTLKSHVISYCTCFNKPQERNYKLVKVLKDGNISTKEFCESCVATCIKFLPYDTEITPIPLRAEMFRSEDTFPGSRNDDEYFWFDWAVVDGKVYLYFLQYLVYSKLGKHANKRVAIDNLNWVLSDDRNLHHEETGYNLLGWIYVQEGRSQDAIRCFMASWRIRPHHNAAKFHIRKLAQDMMQM